MKRKFLPLLLLFLLVLPLLSFLNIQPTQAVFGAEDIIFEFGVESGVLQPPLDWSGAEGSGTQEGSGVVVDSTHVRSGTEAMKFYQGSPPKSDAQRRVTAGIIGSANEYYISWWTYFPSSFDTTMEWIKTESSWMSHGGFKLYWGAYEDDHMYWSKGLRASISLSKDATGFYAKGSWSGFDMIDQWDEPAWVNGDNVYISYDTWVHFQVYIKQASSGIVKEWINNQLTLDLSTPTDPAYWGEPEEGDEYRPENGYFPVSIEQYSDQSVPSCEFWVDDIVMATEKITEEYGVEYPSLEFESWESGFENTITSEWNGTETSPIGASATRTTTYVYTDSYSGNLTTNGTKYSYARFVHVVQNTTEIYQRTYVRFAQFPVNGSSFRFLITMDDAGSTNSYVAMYKNSSGTYWKLRIPDVEEDKVYFKDSINIDQWYCVEQRFKVGSSGNSTLWINGTSILNVGGDYSVCGGLETVSPELWLDSLDQSSSVSIYHDNFRVDNVRIGSGKPEIFQAKIFFSAGGETGSGAFSPLQYVTINGSITDASGYYEWSNLTYNTVYTFVVKPPSSYYPAWVLNVDGFYSWNGTHYILTHNVTETQTGYLQIHFFTSSQTYVRSSNGTLSNPSLAETDYEAHHEDSFHFTVEGDTGETTTTEVYIPNQGEPSVVYGASSYSFSGQVLTVNVVHSSSSSIQIVWTQTITWGGFNLYFENSYSLAFQSDNTLNIEVTSGLLNATSGSLSMSDRRGILQFTATNSSTITVSSPDAEGGFQIDIIGATNATETNPFFYQVTISTGDIIIITWGWRLESWIGNYTLFALGMGGLILMIASPTWCAMTIKRKGFDPDSFEMIMYALLIFCVGFGLVVMWLW